MSLVGREREQAALRELLDRAGRGHGHLAVISGEPGIGRTALWTDLLGYALSRRAAVLSGGAVEGGGAYRPIAEALMPLVRAGRVRESAELRPFRSALGHLLPGWAPAAPPEPGIDPVLLLGEGVLRLLLSERLIGRIRASAGLPGLDLEILEIFPWDFGAAVARNSRRGPGLPGRRCRAPDNPAGRHRHEHRCRRRSQPRLEVGLGGPGVGVGVPAGLLRAQAATGGPGQRRGLVADRAGPGQWGGAGPGLRRPVRLGRGAR